MGSLCPFCLNTPSKYFFADITGVERNPWTTMKTDERLHLETSALENSLRNGNQVVTLSTQLIKSNFLIKPPPPQLLIPWVGPLDVYPFGSFWNGRFRRKLTESSQYFIIISLLHCFLLNKQLISLSNFQFLLGYPLGVQEDCFLPVSGQHHHLQKKRLMVKENWLLQ